jgi:CheY-like chemotaxis protein
VSADSFSLDDVIANQELERRPRRARDRAAERRGFKGLGEVLAGSPRRVLQALADAALELCGAQSAGVSIVEQAEGRCVFRWHAVSGRWGHLLWNTLPREYSPCGTVLDRNATQLMVLPERYFTPLAQLPPRVDEVLLVPFTLAGKTVGTVWVVAHEPTCRFDGGDHRLVSKLARFAAVAYEKLCSLSAQDVRDLAFMRRAGRLPASGPQKLLQLKVLVVDDSPDAADSLALLLKGMGHSVKVAHDGESALRLCDGEQPDLVLLDIVMPGMSGNEVATEMRKRLGPAVRIIALSGYGQDEDRARSMAAGFDQHLVKPVDPAFLRSFL